MIEDEELMLKNQSETYSKTAVSKSDTLWNYALQNPNYRRESKNYQKNASCQYYYTLLQRERMNKCPECGSQNISYENHGEEICRECGLVMEENGIEQPFVSETIQSQATHPYLSIAGSKTQEGRIFKSSWMLSTREKNLKIGLSKIDEIASRLSLTKNIIKEARLIFKKSLYSNISIGRDNASLIYASVYMACNIHEIPKTLTEIIEYSEIRSKDLMKAYRVIKTELGLNT